MKILVMSDLHREFYNNQRTLEDLGWGFLDEIDVVVLAGDIGIGTDGLVWASRFFQGKRIVYVPGNHEYYHKNYTEMQKAFKDWKTVDVLNPGVVVIDGVAFIGATLWSKASVKTYSPSQHIIQRSISDFRVIDYDDSEKFSVGRMLEIHEKEYAFLQEALGEAKDLKQILVTHFLPSQECISKRYVNEPLTPYFASDSDELVAAADVCIYGHTHERSTIIHHSGVPMYCNPLGYPNENKEPYTPLIIEV